VEKATIALTVRNPVVPAPASSDADSRRVMVGGIFLLSSETEEGEDRPDNVYVT
jgi:hypothetical protein